MAICDCLKYAEELSTIIVNTVRKYNCDCIMFSGGIDTSFIALSLSLNDIKFHAITVVFDRNSVDVKYSKIVADRLKLDHKVIYGSINDVEWCLKIIMGALKTIDPIEVICDIPVCIGLKYALNRGCKCVLTGDGGDELLLGYSFLTTLTVNNLKTWLNNIKHKQFFSSEKIGEYMGLKVIPGFFTNSIRKYSQKIPLECLINSYNNVKWGKFLLRMFLNKYGLKEIAWRKKTPINIGSGSNILLRKIGENMGVREIVKLYRSSGIYFPSRAHAYLYKKLLEYGVKPPSTCNNPNKICPICGRCMSMNHCSFCGASVEDEYRLNVFSDEILWSIFKYR